MLTTAERNAAAGRSGQGVPRPRRTEVPEGSDAATGSVLPGLADGYVMAVALLVIGWITLFSARVPPVG